MAKVSKRNWTYKGEQRSAWVVRYKEGGKHRSKQFDKKKDADAFRVRIEGLEASGTQLIDSQITVDQVMDLFMNLQENRLSDGRIGRAHYSTYDVSIRISLSPILGFRKMADLTANHIEDAHSQMVRQGGLNPRSALKRIKQLSAICDFAVRRGFARENVAPAALKELRGIPPAKIRTFQPAEITHLMRVLATKGKNCKARSHLLLQCHVHLAAFCGLRSGEIMGLTVGSLDFDRRIIKVRHSLTKWDELKGPKTKAGNRDIPMPEHISELLKEWVKKFYNENPRGLVFRTPSGARCRRANFRRQWVGLLQRAGLYDEADCFHFHALRHFASSWMIANGLPITDVANLLGHDKFDMTLQVYAHPVMATNVRQDAFDRMSGLLLAAE